MNLFKRKNEPSSLEQSETPDPQLVTAIDHLESGEYSEAEVIFEKMLSRESEYNTFSKLDSMIRQASSKKGKINILLSTRRALLGLGIIQAMNHDFQTAEDYILDATYSSENAELYLIAGKYYLAIPNAELSTAFGYFQMAVELQPNLLGKCDELVQIFHKDRGVFYPVFSIKPYLEHWNNFRDTMSKKVKTNQTDAFFDEFTNRFLEVLQVLDIVGENRLKKQIKG